MIILALALVGGLFFGFAIIRPIRVLVWRHFSSEDDGRFDRPPGHTLYRPDTVGWHADPLGHYPRRWWDGAVWTENVRNGPDETTDAAPMSRDIRNCPVAVMRSARWWPSDLPSDGHQTCPVG